MNKYHRKREEAKNRTGGRSQLFLQQYNEFLLKTKQWGELQPRSSMYIFLETPWAIMVWESMFPYCSLDTIGWMSVQTTKQWRHDHTWWPRLGICVNCCHCGCYAKQNERLAAVWEKCIFFGVGMFEHFIIRFSFINFTGAYSFKTTQLPRTGEAFTAIYNWEWLFSFIVYLNRTEWSGCKQKYRISTTGQHCHFFCSCSTE